MSLANRLPVATCQHQQAIPESNGWGSSMKFNAPYSFCEECARWVFPSESAVKLPGPRCAICDAPDHRIATIHYTECPNVMIEALGFPYETVEPEPLTREEIAEELELLATQGPGSDWDPKLKTLVDNHGRPWKHWQVRAQEILDRI